MCRKGVPSDAPSTAAYAAVAPCDDVAAPRTATARIVRVDCVSVWLNDKRRLFGGGCLQEALALANSMLALLPQRVTNDPLRFLFFCFCF
jgi:hypothetical protein